MTECSQCGFTKRNWCLTIQPSTIRWLAWWMWGEKLLLWTENWWTWLRGLWSAAQSPVGGQSLEMYHKGLSLGTKLLNVFIINLDDGKGCTLSKCATDTELGEMFDNVWWLHCRSEGTQQEREMGWQQPHEVQQKEIGRPAPAEE